jgi:hypothetical protein
MLDSFQIYEELSKTIGDEAAKSLTKTLTKIYDDLSNTVTKVEFNELKEIVSELAEAQRKTEQRLEELAEAQKKTEESLNKLIKRVDNIEVQLGGLSMAVGYGIEDKLYPHISKFAQKYFGITVEDTVLRKNVIYPDGKFDEINLYISGKKDEKDVLVLGECKAQPGKKDIDKFMKMVSRLKDFFKKEIFPFVVGYTFNPIVEQYILKRYPELKFFKTYEIEYEKY